MAQRMTPIEELEDRVTDLEGELKQTNTELGRALELLEETTEKLVEALPRHSWNTNAYHARVLKLQHAERIKRGGAT